MGQRHSANRGGVSEESPQDQMPHIPVLLDEVVAALAPCHAGTIVDGTFGAGGYSRALLAAGASVIGIDRDPGVLPFAEKLASDFGPRFAFVAGRFAELDMLAEGRGPVCGVVLDIGVSSMQIDDAERGFSFMKPGPLDMRMAQAGTSAADLVNELDEAQLANILFLFGEERKSRRIAKAIIAARPIRTTNELAELIEKTIGRKPGDNHPATRSFQALRIAVNGEFEELVEGLFAAERLLNAGGILAVVTFHSIEDRIVKRFFAPEKAAPQRSRHLPDMARPELRWIDVARPVKPGADELKRNPRARSATLRFATRTAIGARPVDSSGLGVPQIKKGRAA